MTTQQITFLLPSYGTATLTLPKLLPSIVRRSRVRSVMREYVKTASSTREVSVIPPIRTQRTKSSPANLYGRRPGALF